MDPKERFKNHEATGENIAGVYAGLGDKDRAFEWLEKDYQAHSGLLPRLQWEIAYEPLRGDPRYASLLQRMGLKTN